MINQFCVFKVDLLCSEGGVPPALFIEQKCYGLAPRDFMKNTPAVPPHIDRWNDILLIFSSKNSDFSKNVMDWAKAELKKYNISESDRAKKSPALAQSIMFFENLLFFKEKTSKISFHQVMWGGYRWGVFHEVPRSQAITFLSNTQCRRYPPPFRT